MEKRIIQVEERPPLALNIPLSIQHLFAMFGSTVLVPFLFNVPAQYPASVCNVRLYGARSVFV